MNGSDYFTINKSGYATKVVNGVQTDSGDILPTVSTTALTPGTSSLATGKVYLKYD